VFWDASLSDLTVSLTDLVTLGEAIAGISKPSIFSPSTLQMLREPQVELPKTVGGALQEQMPIAFGMGCAQYGTSVFGHNGSARGQTCALRFDSSSGTVLAVGLGCWRPHARDFLCARLLAALSAPSDGATESADTEWSFTELDGRYLGAHGIWVNVTTHDRERALEIVNSSNTSPTRVLLTRRQDGSVDVQSPASHLTVGFFSEKRNGRHALMVGLNAYCRDGQHEGSPATLM
jgi:hypothetical protein